jgi:hypothetical protein
MDDVSSPRPSLNSFEKIVEKGAIYADKTPFLSRLIEGKRPFSHQKR